VLRKTVVVSSMDAAMKSSVNEWILRLYFAEGFPPSIIRIMPDCQFAFPARTLADTLQQT